MTVSDETLARWSLLPASDPLGALLAQNDRLASDLHAACADRDRYIARCKELGARLDEIRKLVR